MVIIAEYLAKRKNEADYTDIEFLLKIKRYPKMTN